MNKLTESALLAMDKFFLANKDENTLLHRARLRAIVRAYGQRWANDSELYEALEVEKLLLGKIVSMDSGKDSGFTAGGKIDAIIKERVGSKNLIVLDHKFLSTEFTPEKAQHLTIDGQPSQYAYLCWANGIEVTHVLWDAVVKSLHRKGKNESYESLEERIYGIYIEDNSKFSRFKVPVIKDNIAEYLNELYHWAKEIGMESKGNVHLKSRGHCFEFNRACKYLGICTGYSDSNDGTWNSGGTNHAELVLDKDINPFTILTNSRLKEYQTCRTKHHLHYNLGLSKIKEETEEPLFVGTAGHHGLQAYWETIASGQ